MLLVRKKKSDKPDKDGFIPIQNVEEFPFSPTENKESVDTTNIGTIQKRIIKHAKSVVGGKLYDTETAEYIAKLEDGRILFETQFGNYFTCRSMVDDYRGVDSYVCVDVYGDIKPETREFAKEIIGRCDVEKYIELFGEPEQA